MLGMLENRSSIPQLVNNVFIVVNLLYCRCQLVESTKVAV